MIAPLNLKRVWDGLSLPAAAAWASVVKNECAYSELDYRHLMLDSSVLHLRSFGIR
jgi:hypothetical protein